MWEDAWTRGRLGLQNTRRLSELASTGGAVWFMEVLVAKLSAQVRT